MKKNTTLTEKEYIKSGGTICPYCRSKNISSDGIEIDGMEGVARVICNDCGLDWNDTWRLSGWFPI
jgi:transposase-like protein